MAKHGHDTTGLQAGLLPAGTTVTIPEDAYRYGTGKLTMRVCTADLMEGSPGWAYITGEPVHWTGRLMPVRGVMVTLSWIDAWRAVHAAA